MDPTLAALARYRPTVAAGSARRWLEGPEVHDAIQFVYAAPDRWRVRRADGTELVAVGPVSWQRLGRDAGWARHEDEHGRAPHHSGYVRDMLFPGRVQVLTDRRTTVAYTEVRVDGSLHLLLEAHEPEPLRWSVDVAAAGYLTGLEATAPGGRRVGRVEMIADVSPDLDPGVFDPATDWDPLPPPWHRPA